LPGRVAEVATVFGLALIVTVAIAAPVLRAPSERVCGGCSEALAQPKIEDGLRKSELVLRERPIRGQPIDDLRQHLRELLRQVLHRHPGSGGKLLHQTRH